jgi:hypothetical protein
VLDYADADPGEPIRIRQTSSAAESTPAEGSHGLLGLAAVELLARRKIRLLPKS